MNRKKKTWNLFIHSVSPIVVDEQWKSLLKDVAHTKSLHELREVWVNSCKRYSPRVFMDIELPLAQKITELHMVGG